MEMPSPSRSSGRAMLLNRQARLKAQLVSVGCDLAAGISQLDDECDLVHGNSGDDLNFRLETIRPGDFVGAEMASNSGSLLTALDTTQIHSRVGSPISLGYQSFSLASRSSPRRFSSLSCRHPALLATSPRCGSTEEHLEAKRTRIPPSEATSLIPPRLNISLIDSRLNRCSGHQPLGQRRCSEPGPTSPRLRTSSRTQQWINGRIEEEGRAAACQPPTSLERRLLTLEKFAAVVQAKMDFVEEDRLRQIEDLEMSTADMAMAETRWRTERQKLIQEVQEVRHELQSAWAARILLIESEIQQQEQRRAEVRGRSDSIASLASLIRDAELVANEKFPGTRSPSKSRRAKLLAIWAEERKKFLQGGEENSREMLASCSEERENFLQRENEDSSLLQACLD